MTRRRLAALLLAVVAACSDEPAPEPVEPGPALLLGEGTHLDLARTPGWELDSPAAAEDLDPTSRFAVPVLAFEGGVATVVGVPPDAVEHQIGYLGPFIRPAARREGGETLLVSPRGGGDAGEALAHLEIRQGRPAAADGELEVLGELPTGWHAPDGAVRFEAAGRERRGQVTAVLLEPDEVAAMRTLLVDEQHAYPGDGSVPEVPIEAARELEVGGRRAWVGHVGPYDRALVIDGDPGAALVATDGLLDADLVQIVRALRAVDAETARTSREAWLAASAAEHERWAEDAVRTGLFLNRTQERWRERVGSTIHVLFASDVQPDRPFCTATVVVPRTDWNRRVAVTTCAPPPVPHVSGTRTREADEVWGLAGPEVAEVHLRVEGAEPVAARIVDDAAGLRWWVVPLDGGLEGRAVTVAALDGGGRLLQELAWV